MRGTRAPELIIMLSGAALILVGISMVGAQLYVELMTGSFAGGEIMSGARVTPSSGLDVSTSYVGVMLIAIGAGLEIIGYMASRPWRTDQNSK